MPSAYIITDQHAPYFLTFQVVSWIDLFSRKAYRDQIVESLNYCSIHKDLRIHAWVIMSNYVHAILSSRTGTLSSTIRDFKSHTARQILQQIQTTPESRQEWLLTGFRQAAQAHVRNEVYQLWTHENHAVELRHDKPDQVKRVLDYIHQNPVKNGLVLHPEDYLYSSARDYAGKRGLVRLTKLT